MRQCWVPLAIAIVLTGLGNPAGTAQQALERWASMALGAEAYSRFRVPVIALYAMLCGGGAALVRDKQRLTS